MPVILWPGTIAVKAYQTSFIVCMVALLIGAVAMYFTTDTKVVTKKAA